MMWQQTLKKIDPLSTPHQAVTLWNGDKNSLKLINNGINLVYRFERNGKGFYLRITHPLIRPRVELAAAIDFQKHLFKWEVPVCEPIPSEAGHYIEEIQQEDLLFLSHVSAEVPGKIISFTRDEKDMYKTWGKALAKLHDAAHHYQSEHHHFKNWADIWQETGTYLSSEDSFIKDEYHAIDDWVQTFLQTPDNFGLTHGDHRTGNVLYDGKEVYIIDFDEPLYHWYLSDIARPFLELSPLKFSIWKQKFEWYLGGYQEVRALSSLDFQNISWFSRMKALDIYLWSKNNWEDLNAPDGKRHDEWLEKLRFLIAHPIFLNI